MLHDVQLEVSFKAFLHRGNPGVEAVCREMFAQYRPLWEDAKRISVLLWTGDGGEILEYTGDRSRKFDWCRYLGIVNRSVPPDEAAADPERRNGYTGQYFEPGTDLTDYAFFAEVVRTVKAVGAEMSGRKIAVGDAFDPGPEFTVSEFKYRTHKECCRGSYGVRPELLSCHSVLNGDPEPYAAFPGGIPAGTCFGAFFGRQLELFLRDMEMDFVWLSNGFGFGNFPWILTGDTFDGERFFPEKGDRERGRMLEFWKEFRAHCSFPVRVRGSNFGTGVELATDAAPIREIYEQGGLEYPPVNSPWAPINQDVGSELTGWMSHLAGWKKRDILFRLYLHDPWFPSSPWLDRYGREPYDIYMPLAVSRLRHDGTVDTANAVSLLTVDNRFGEMPSQVPREALPHVAAALRDAPDEPGPFVWVYPFDRYHEWIAPERGRPDEVLFGDLFARALSNAGFPLNSVVNADDCSALPDGVAAVSPVPEAESRWEKALLDFAARGNTVLFYGPMRHASPALLDAFGITIGSGLEGECELESPELPSFSGKKSFFHRSIVSGGAICECGGKHPLCTVRQGESRRTYGALAFRGEGRLLYLRGSIDQYHAYVVGDRLKFGGKDSGLFPELLAAKLLEECGWKMEIVRPDETCYFPAQTLHWHENALYFSGLNRTLPTVQLWKTPWGAPIPVGGDIMLEGGAAKLQWPRSYHAECRIFVKQSGDGLVSCVEYSPTVRDQSRFLFLRNLRDAEVRIAVPESERGKLEVRRVSGDAYMTVPLEEFETVEEHGRKLWKVRKTLSGNWMVAN